MSTLVLPKNVLLEKALAANAAKSAQVPKNMGMAPGWVRFEPIDLGHRMTASGLSIAAKDRHSTTKYGKVIACGMYQDRMGNIHPDLPSYPLPAGTIIEFRHHDPWQNHDGSLTVATHDVVAFGLPEKEK